VHSAEAMRLSPPAACTARRRGGQCGRAARLACAFGYVDEPTCGVHCAPARRMAASSSAVAGGAPVAGRAASAAAALVSASRTAATACSFSPTSKMALCGRSGPYDELYVSRVAATACKFLRTSKMTLHSR